MPSPTRWLVLAIISSALLLIVIDMTVLYTALPQLTYSLRASMSEKLWIVNAYALTVAGLLPAMGSLSDRYGPKRLFGCGLAVFGCASLMAAFAPDPAALIAARVVLAVGAAMMMPATLSIVRQIFEDPNERALAIGIWAAVASGGAAFGPVVGGLLLDYFWWGSVFLINVPIVMVALILAVTMIPPFKGNPDRPFDPWASIQIMLGLVGLTYAVKEASKLAPSVETALITGAAGILFTALFVRRQRRSRAPMIDFTLFRNRSFTAGVIAALVSSAALLGLELAVSQRFQLALGLSPLEAGLMILPIPLAAFIAGPLAGLLLPRVGPHPLLGASLAVAGGGVFGYLAASEAGLALQLAALAAIGLGLGAAMTAASTAIMLNAPAHSAGMAASVEEVSYELGGSMGIALLGSLMAVVYAASFHPPAEGAGGGLARNSLDEAILAAEDLSAPAAAALIEAAHQAFHSSFVAVLAAAGLLLCASALALSLAARGARA